MSKIYDDWEKLVGAVLRREKDRELAYCDSFSTSYSTDFSSRFSFEIGDVDLPADLWSQNIVFSGNVKAIEYEEIRKATRNFRPSNMLEGGPSCCVYKGWIDEHYAAAKLGFGTAIAVKMMNNTSKMSLQKWVNEIEDLGHLRHPNLLTLIGYSFDTDTDMRILVCEFMPKGCLDDYLKGGQTNGLFRGRWPGELPWTSRVKVAIGAARALAFLHGLETPVIYRVFRSDNILLDGDFNAKLSEIGLTSRYEIEGPRGMMHEVGATYEAYAAPEYIATGQWSTKCDVYSFGVVLVEIISGRRRALDRNLTAAEHNLIDWWSRLKDRELLSGFPVKEAYEVGKIALECASPDPRLRPSMAEVVSALEQLFILLNNQDA